MKPGTREAAEHDKDTCLAVNFVAGFTAVTLGKCVLVTNDSKSNVMGNMKFSSVQSPCEKIIFQIVGGGL